MGLVAQIAAAGGVIKANRTCYVNKSLRSTRNSMCNCCIKNDVDKDFLRKTSPSTFLDTNRKSFSGQLSLTNSLIANGLEFTIAAMEFKISSLQSNWAFAKLGEIFYEALSNSLSLHFDSLPSRKVSCRA